VAGKGRAISPEEAQKVVILLATTGMTIEEIAKRMGLSKTTITGINRKHHVRDYEGNRSTWKVLAA
jgi:transposase